MKQFPLIPDVLAARYASSTLRECWTAENKVLMERDFWLALMRAQKELGLDIPDEAIDAYAKVRDEVNMERIAERERKLRHDLKARIEEYCDLAGHQQIHKGLTSRDLTDNVEQLQILHSLRLIRLKSIAGLKRLAGQAAKTREDILTARTHNVPAQLTTVGKRLSMFGEEILFALERLDRFIEIYPLRGLQGAVGTNLDQTVLFHGDLRKVQLLDERIAGHLGASRVMNAVGQTYPRSLDLQTVQVLISLSSGISSFAKTLRLMAGAGLAHEGFGKNQVGSSAMPHKRNARTCERICGFHQILRGFETMLSGLVGDQWNEGDVSCSVVRRVALPGAFFAFDGQLESWLNVLEEMEFDEQAQADEVERNLPFVSSTLLLMEGVRKGGGREDVHEAVRRHMLYLNEKPADDSQQTRKLAKNLGTDDDYPLGKPEIEKLLNHPENWLGNAKEQVDAFTESVGAWIQHFPEASSIKREPLL